MTVLQTRVAGLKKREELQSEDILAEGYDECNTKG